MQTIIETPAYLADAAKIGLTAEERVGIVNAVARNPEAGDVIPAAGGARKRRPARVGGGKSGGLRLLTDYVGENEPVLLLRVFAKSDRANHPKAERNTLRKEKADRR